MKWTFVSGLVLHFYAFGCINCKNNYSVYLDWQERFKDENVAIIGIQTPEIKAEYDIDLIQQRAEEAGFTFPILTDIEKNNWHPTPFLPDGVHSLTEVGGQI